MGTKEICILIMGYDPACFNIVAEMLPYCPPTVLNFDQITNALNAIWKSKDRLEFVLTNIQRSDANRFEFIQQIEQEFKLPIISISSDESNKTVPQGLESGITLYFVKSLSMNNINKLRQFAYVKERGKLVEPEIAASAQMASTAENAIDQAGTINASSVVETFGGYEKQKKRETKKRTKSSEDCPDDYSCEKKRVVWTPEMHGKFLEAIQHLGHERAFPRKIVKVMDVPGLTRENVASHLQKYRMSLRRGQEAKQYPISNYVTNLSADVQGTCCPSSYLLPHKYSSQGSYPHQLQQTNLTSLQQLSDITISTQPTHNSCFTNAEASTSRSTMGHQQLLTVRNQGNLHYPYIHNVSSVQTMPRNNTNYLELASSQPNCQIGSTQGKSYVPNIPVNNEFRLYGDHTKNILFSTENSMPSSNTNYTGTCPNTGNTYVGYRLTINGKSVGFGQMGVIGNDEIRTQEDPSAEGNLLNESSVHLPSTSLNCISQEQHTLSPLLRLQQELDSLGDDEDFNVLLNATESTSPQRLWDKDFVDALLDNAD